LTHQHRKASVEEPRNGSESEGESDDVVRRVLDFWFGEPGDDGVFPFRKIWFEKSDTFDALIVDQFESDYQRAARGDLDALMAGAEGCLALIILLDQFPRNMFRGDPQSYATDEKALEISQHALAEGFDEAMQAHPRLFLYLPHEHSEDLAHQVRYTALALSLNDPARMKPANRHREIIERFGRFPHRNKVLGRDSTPEELAFLEEPYSSF
jgi:uncharacterized protein (DUF924 family)